MSTDAPLSGSRQVCFGSFKSTIKQTVPLPWSRSLWPIRLQLDEDAYTLLLSSDRSTCGEIIDPQHIAAIRSFRKLDSIVFQHYAIVSAAAAEGVIMWSNMYGSIERLGLMGRLYEWDITLQEPRYCDRDVEYHNPHTWPCFREDGRIIRTWDHSPSFPSIEEILAETIIEPIFT